MTEAAEFAVGTTTLLDRVGGRERVFAVVWRFYEFVEEDADLRAIYPEDLAPGREKLAQFLVQWMGGPPLYSEIHGHPRLRMRHFPFAVTDRLTGRWLRHIRQAMKEQDVGEPEQREIFAALAPLARHMINTES
ncbi:MAG: globin [Tepidiformaceae bacterium]